jgi:predicted TIM-barrel fold metal-dependent hydrolase
VQHDGDGHRPHSVLGRYPFAENPPGTEWLKTLPLGPEDTEKLLNDNARRLLKL